MNYSSKSNINLIDLSELSSLIKVSSKWIRQQAKKDKNPLPHYVVGNKFRFYYPKVLDWLDAKTRNKL